MYKANHLKVIFNLVTEIQKKENCKTRRVIFMQNVKWAVRISLQTLTSFCNTATTKKW